MCVVVFFFFKQKTAYEMRISDWSSDVCSSDLCPVAIQVILECLDTAVALPRIGAQAAGDDDVQVAAQRACPRRAECRCPTAWQGRRLLRNPGQRIRIGPRLGRVRLLARRSEERRVGTEWSSACRSRGPPFHNRKTHNTLRSSERPTQSAHTKQPQK